MLENDKDLLTRWRLGSPTNFFSNEKSKIGPKFSVSFGAIWCTARQI